MTSNKQPRVAVVVLNWNGEEDSLACIAALKKQTQAHIIVAVDNASDDSFVKTVSKNHKDVILLTNSKNKGFSGGVNTGIQYALLKKYDFVALINNDAKPEKQWLEKLIEVMKDSRVGIATGKLLKTDGTIDSTGDLFTSWGLAYPRGRNEPDNGQYDKPEKVFSGTGGASLYRCKMLEQIGLFDEKFFAYYEDVDLSFRAQLAGWGVAYNPKAVAHHKIGASSGKVPGFTTYMTIKNLPWLAFKNAPLGLILTIWPRLFVAHVSFVFAALFRGDIIPALKGLIVGLLYTPLMFIKRRHIQKTRKVKTAHIKKLITYDLPPNAYKLRKLRSFVRRFRVWRHYPNP